MKRREKKHGNSNPGRFGRNTKKIEQRCTECGALIAAEECLACYLRDPNRYTFDAELYAGVFISTEQKKKLAKAASAR
jgi:hypothetical protein